MKWQRNISFAIGGILLLVLSLTDLLWRHHLANDDIIFMLRLPRIVTALIAGGALAVSGAQMQSVFRNPLADPHIMGISAGAAFGAAIATMTGCADVSIVTASCIGAASSASAVIAASGRFKNAATLLIFGVMLGFIVNAAVTALQFSTDAESLKIFYSWSAGSFSSSRWKDIIIMAIALASGIIFPLSGHKRLDIILFGDDFAQLAGGNLKVTRFLALTSCCLMTGAITAFCGPIGFIGIVAPHIARFVFRTSAHRIVIPGSLLTGCIIAVSADLISQISPIPVPVSSTMALIGIPVVIYILYRNTSATWQS